jgi:hypothetical protein
VVVLCCLTPLSLLHNGVVFSQLGPEQTDFDHLATLSSELRQGLPAHLYAPVEHQEVPCHQPRLDRHVPQLGEGGIDTYRLQQTLHAAAVGHPKAKVPKLQGPESTDEAKMAGVMRKLASVGRVVDERVGMTNHDIY